MKKATLEILQLETFSYWYKMKSENAEMMRKERKPVEEGGEDPGENRPSEKGAAKARLDENHPFPILVFYLLDIYL